MDKSSQINCGDAISIAKIQPCEIILKIGCVNMYGLLKLAHLADKGGIVIGVDNSREILFRAKGLLMTEKVTNVSLLECEINHLPIKDNTIDVIICNGIHNHKYDRQHIFMQFHRVLKVGGRAIITDIIAPRPKSPILSIDSERTSENCPRAISKQKYFSDIKSSGLVLKEYEDESYHRNDYLMGHVTYSLIKN